MTQVYRIGPSMRLWTAPCHRARPLLIDIAKRRSIPITRMAATLLLRVFRPK